MRLRAILKMSLTAILNNDHKVVPKARLTFEFMYMGVGVGGLKLSF